MFIEAFTYDNSNTPKYSTNTLDIGNNARDLGTGEDLYVVWVQTSVGDTDGATVDLIGDSAEPLDGSSVVLQRLFETATDTPVGTTYIARLNPGAITGYRYLGLKINCPDADGNGAATCFIAKDISKWTAKAQAALAKLPLVHA